MNILEEANRITKGARNEAYGDPAPDWNTAAEIWTAILHHAHVLPHGRRITGAQAILCIIAVKMVREAHLHKRDNLTDIAGYARCLSVVMGDEQQKESGQ